METEGFAIYDTMMNVKNEVRKPLVFVAQHAVWVKVERGRCRGFRIVK